MSVFSVHLDGGGGPGVALPGRTAMSYGTPGCPKGRVPSTGGIETAGRMTKGGRVPWDFRGLGHTRGQLERACGGQRLIIRVIDVSEAGCYFVCACAGLGFLC